MVLESWGWAPGQELARLEVVVRSAAVGLRLRQEGTLWCKRCC